MQPQPESAPAQNAGSRSRRILLITLGCCAGLVLCVLLACAAVAGSLLIVQRTTTTNPEFYSTGKSSLPTSELQGNAQAGEQVFNNDGSCSACHSIISDARIVGPSLLGIGERAADRVPGSDAEQYIYESILDPGAFIVDGYSGAIMPANYGQQFSQQQLADLVAFLLSK